MLFALYREDGSIHQANKVYDDPDAHRNILLEREHKFVERNSHGPVSPDYWHVDLSTMQLSERPMMPITVDKKVVKAGGNDYVLFRGIPKGAKYVISTMNIPVHAGSLPGGELELHIPVPCIYKVAFEMWPFKRFEVDIEAIA